MKKTTIKIMLADDHILLRKGLASLLNTFANCQVIADVDNGSLLMDKLLTASTLPQICIIDINMPVLDGYQTAKLIRSKFPTIKIIALSMYDNEFNIIQMLRNGANGYLLKNASPTEMFNAIKGVLEQGYYHSDLVNPRMIELIQDQKKTYGVDLTENEKEFLLLSCSEMTYKEIAEHLCKSPRTIDGYRDALLIKLNATSRIGLVMYALKTGLLPI